MEDLSAGRVPMKFGAGFYGPLRMYPHEWVCEMCHLHIYVKDAMFKP